jgi:hypothetical protein
MTHRLLYLAQLVINLNGALLGVEGTLLGLVLFGGLLALVRRRAQKEAR